DWSTKLIRGLTSEAPAGFRSRRGPSHDSTLVTPHNAPFSTYKAPRVHQAARRRGGRVAARGGCSATGDAGDWVSWRAVGRALRAICGSDSSRPERSRVRRRSECEVRIPLGGWSLLSPAGAGG